MPLQSKSGVSQGSRSTLFGSAMQAKPAPSSRPPSAGGAFKAGSNSGRPFAAPVSNRSAAEQRIMRLGKGGVDDFQSRPAPTLNPADASGLPAAGARKAADMEREQVVRPGRAPGRPPLTGDASNFLHDGTGGVPMPASPSVFSSRSKQAAMMPESAASTPRSSARQASEAAMPQTQQAQRWANSSNVLTQQQRMMMMQGRSAQSRADAAALVSGDFTVTDVTDHEEVVPTRPQQQQQSQSQQYPSQQPPQYQSQQPPQYQPPSGQLQPLSEDNAFLESLHLAPEVLDAVQQRAAPDRSSMSAMSASVRGSARPAAAPPYVVEEEPPPAAAAAPPAPPQPIDPKDAALGAGVFAKVRMTHGRDGQIVAVKTYNHKEAREERAVAKHMENEERLAGKLQHENIIAPQLARKGDGCTELEMEYAPGGTLEAFIKKLGRALTEDEARKIFRQLVDAVVYLHEEKGICHRDIKMENVVLDAGGRARLVDFGAAKEGGAHTFLTSMQGTPAYMAPELAQLRAHKGGPADVWALGVLLYNLITGGAFPFWGRSMDELKRNITASLPKLPPHLSPSCKDLITKLLQKSSAIRLSSGDVRRHPWVSMPDPPGSSDLPTVGASSSAAAAASSALAPPPQQQNAVNAAVAADAAAAAEAYRGELNAAREAAARRLQQHGIPPSPRGQQQQQQQQNGQNGRAAAPATAAGRHSAAPASPRTGHAQNAQNGMYLNAGYQAYSRNPITGGHTYDSRPSSPGGSKLAGLMNGNGRPGTACSSGRSASEAQLNAYRRR